MAALIDLGMYPISGVMGDKATMDLVGPYEYFLSHSEVEAKLTAHQDRINHGGNPNSMLISLGSS